MTRDLERLKKEAAAVLKTASAKHRDQAFDLDKAFAYRALQDSRGYVVDIDRSGRKAEEIYKRLEKAARIMRPYTTDGTNVQAKKAVEYMEEIVSVLSHKIGPASRREFVEQGGKRTA